MLTASYAFYLISSPKTFIFVLFTTVITFFGGRKIGEYNTTYNEYMAVHKKDMSREERKEAKAANQTKKKKIVALILILNFGILAVLKYFRYYLQSFGLFDTGSLLIPL